MSTPSHSVNAATVAALFLERVAATPDRPAYQFREGEGWKTVTWRQFAERVRHIAQGLQALGLKPEERCAILSGTRYEWVLADTAILCAGGATTTIYPSNTADECVFILNDSGAAYAFVENQEQLSKLLVHRPALTQLRQVILLEGGPSTDAWVLTLDQLEARGRAYEDAHRGSFEATARAVRKDSLATLIYTSGTTGRPKGVELTHDCWVYEAEAIDALRILTYDDIQYLWLPLAHAFGKVLEVAQLRIGFLTAVEGKVERLVESLAVIRPTFVAAVPRILEKVHNRVVQNAQEQGGLKYQIFRWALLVGERYSKEQQAGRRPGGLLALEHAVADRLVYSKVKERFGGRLKFFVSGSAPLSKEVAEFFHAVDVLVLEGYGLTETSAASFVNLPERFRFGTVGPALPGTEVKIDPADGEILIKGRGLMRGYHGLPEETASTLTPDGWIRTGDIGVVVDGFLKITDRKKDLIKTSGGKYVAPQVFEGKLKAVCPYVSQVLVHGDNRNFCSALITLDPEAIHAWAVKNGLPSLGYRELAGEPRVRALIEACVEEVNQGLAAYESVRKFALLPEDLSLEAGELTPSMKVKRKVVEQKYKPILDSFYAGSVQQV